MIRKGYFKGAESRNPAPLHLALSYLDATKKMLEHGKKNTDISIGGIRSRAHTFKKEISEEVMNKWKARL